MPNMHRKRWMRKGTYLLYEKMIQIVEKGERKNYYSLSKQKYGWLFCQYNICINLYTYNDQIIISIRSFTSRFFYGGPPRSEEKQKKMAVEQKCSYRSLIQIERQLANWIWHNFLPAAAINRTDYELLCQPHYTISLLGAYIGLSHHCRYSALNTVQWEQKRPRLEDRFIVFSFHLYLKIFKI